MKLSRPEDGGRPVRRQDNVTPGALPMNRRQFIGLSAGAGMAALLAACGSSDGGSGSGKSSGILNVAISSDPEGLDPIKYSVASVIVAYTPVMEGLYTYDSKGSLTPVLAAGPPQINAAGTQFTIPLRKGVTFHNGKAFGSDDVKYTIEQLINPANASLHASALLTAHVTSVETPDASTVVINTANPYRYLMQDITTVYDVIVPANVPYTPNTYAQKMIGTGPFKFDSWVHGQSITLTRNDSYWQKGLPHLQGVKYQIIPNLAAQIAGLSNGTIHLVPGLPPRNVDVARGRGANVYMGTVTQGIDWLWPNWAPGHPTSDVNMRLAIAYVINRNRLNQVVYKNLARPEFTIPARGTMGYDSSIGIDPNGDVSAAKKYLSAAGGPPSTPIKLLSPSGFPSAATSCQLIQEDLAAIGIRTQILQESSPAATAAAAQGNFDLWFWSGTVSVAPTQAALLYNPAHVINYNKVNDAQLTAVATQAVNDASAVPQVQKRALEVQPEIPLVTYPPVFAMAKGVQGFTDTRGGGYLSSLADTRLA